MSEITAQLIIREIGAFPCSIIKTVYLYENERPAFVFDAIANHDSNKEIIVIPTQENTFDDLMIALVLAFKKEDKMVKIIKEYMDHNLKGVTMYDIPDKTRKELYEICKNIDWSNLHLVLTTFNESLLIDNIDQIENYNIKIEVFKSAY